MTVEQPVLRRFPRPARTVGYALIIGLAMLYLLPFVLQVANSFKTEADASANPLGLWPATPTTTAYERLFGIGEAADSVPFLRWLSNSVVVTVLVTAGRVLFDSMAGYALARLRFRGRALLTACVIGVMAVPGIVLLIPKFLVLNYISMYNTLPALFVPLMVDAASVFIMKQFFETIPVSVEEAARIDGAGTFRTFWSIVLPMAKPALITLTILSFQSSWNELPHFIIATNDSDLYTLTRGLAQLTSGGLGAGQQFPISMSAALLMTIPTALVFVVFQRFFTQGANVGGEKG
jgi:multiple sugar transport system permease protein